MSGILRICTAGSVDDGKSTLIGRLLYDSRGVYEDQIRSVQAASRNRTSGPKNCRARAAESRINQNLLVSS